MVWKNHLVRMKRCLVCMNKHLSGMCVPCAKRSGSGGRGRRALSWQATEAFSWANLEGRHEKSTALHESRATSNHVVLCSLHCTLRYIYDQTPLALHKQGSQRGGSVSVWEQAGMWHSSSVVRGTEKEIGSELKRRKQMIWGNDSLRFIRTGVLRLNLSLYKHCTHQARDVGKWWLCHGNIWSISGQAQRQSLKLKRLHVLFLSHELAYLLFHIVTTLAHLSS